MRQTMGQREKMLKKVQETGFMVDDIQLFLDTHPDSSEAFEALQHYLRLEQEAREAYESCYGPLTIGSMAYRTRYDWVNHIWPWEVEA